jgi:hypothetical protein
MRRSFALVLSAVMAYTVCLMAVTGAPLWGVTDEEAGAMVGGACALFKAETCGGPDNTACPNGEIGGVQSVTGGIRNDPNRYMTVACGADLMSCGRVTKNGACVSVTGITAVSTGQ